MTETQTAVWKPVPGFSRYEASAGQPGVATTAALSPVRTTAGAAMTARRQNRGYWIVDLTGDDGVRRTITVHRVVLLAHRGRPGAGEKTRHLDDDPSHNWLDNLVWGTQSENELDKFRNGQPKPVPPKRPKQPCILCGRPVDRGGKRCHACVVDLGRRGARLLRAGVPLEVAALRLDYQPAHLHTLAVKYGGYGVPWPRRARARLVTLRARIRVAATAVTHRDRP